ncbi:Methyltransferase type 11 [Pleurostoma richardsiae]|uniref:Methyltransferase type 11 n=1 Tax=Pleurostoma richardsiae TaxID=41990 RepID=A0AA38S7H7_9PEZI|nr:Methyltransferase type 11 [Pleurostoma richardsiae]
MNPQYDAIGSKYSLFKTLPLSIAERQNFKDAVQPYLARLSKPRVLDLACGTGYYSHKLLEWGAHSVVGVDLSSGMVDAANATLSEEDKSTGRLRFQVGDALHLGSSAAGDEGPFDIVTGVWLLNYAGSLAEVVQMFSSIAGSLRDGGVFVGIMPHPVEDLDPFAARVQASERANPHPFGVGINYYERLPSGEGWRTEISGHGPDGSVVSFKNFHLRRSVFEDGARQGGMRGKLEWKEVRIPQEAVETYGEELEKYYFAIGPHMGVLVVKK